MCYMLQWFVAGLNQAASDPITNLCWVVPQRQYGIRRIPWKETDQEVGGQIWKQDGLGSLHVVPSRTGKRGLVPSSSGPGWSWVRAGGHESVQRCCPFSLQGDKGTEDRSWSQRSPGMGSTEPSRLQGAVCLVWRRPLGAWGRWRAQNPPRLWELCPQRPLHEWSLSFGTCQKSKPSVLRGNPQE